MSGEHSSFDLSAELAQIYPFSCLLLTLNQQKFLKSFSFLLPHELPIQLGILMEISTSTAAREPFPPHAG